MIGVLLPINSKSPPGGRAISYDRALLLLPTCPTARGSIRAQSKKVLCNRWGFQPQQSLIARRDEGVRPAGGWSIQGH
jgi:hypothetical protein